MDDRRDIADFAHDAAHRDTATPRDDRLPLMSRAEVAARWGVGDRQVQREAKRWGLAPARKVGPQRSPLYDPADVERVARLREAAHPSRDTSAPRDTATVAIVAPAETRLAEALRPLGEQIERLARENADLHRRAEAAEAARLAAERERDELRARLDAAQAAPAATEAPTIVVVEGDSHAPPPPLWRRLLRRLRGG